MSTSYTLNGSAGLLRSNGGDNHQNIQYSTLAGAHQAVGPAAIIPPALLMPSTPKPHSILPIHHGPWVPSLTSNSNSGGLMHMQGLPVVQVSSQSTAFVKRKFPAETYSEVKKHVNEMKKHPYEETLGYKVKCLMATGSRLIMRTKWKVRNRLRIIVGRASRHFRDQ